MILNKSSLIFISKLKKDGSGVTAPDLSKIEEEKFHIIKLCSFEKTFIAVGFESYIVKIK
jgi:hypothetical protein